MKPEMTARRVAVVSMILWALGITACMDGSVESRSEPTLASTSTPIAIPTLSPLTVTAGELLDAYNRNKFHADLEYKFTDNGGIWLRVSGYVTGVEHEHFTLARKPQNAFDFSLEQDITCHYADEDFRLSPALIKGEAVLVTARGEGESLLDGIELRDCQDISEPVNRAPTPTPQRLSLAGSGSEAITFNAREGLYSVEMTVSANSDCSFGACTQAVFFVTVEDESGYPEILANEIALDWEGRKTMRIGSGFGLEPGKQVMTIDTIGEWAITVMEVQ